MMWACIQIPTPVANAEGHPGKLAGLALTGALAMFASAAAVADDCVLDSLDGLTPLVDTRAVGHSADLKLLRGPEEAEPAWSGLRCTDGVLSELRLRLEPGQQQQINLVAEAGVSMPLLLDLDTSQGPASGEWQIVIRPVRLGPDGTLQPRSFVGDEAWISQLVQIEVTAGADNRPGQGQVMQSGDLRLIMEDAREERLFRDNFRIDPTVGQFSRLGRDRAGPDPDRAPVEAGTGL